MRHVRPNLNEVQRIIMGAPDEPPVPAQFVSTPAGPPELKLALAVLDRAVQDYRGAGSDQDRQDAAEWLQHPKRGPISLHVVAGLLNADVEWIQKRAWALPPIRRRDYCQRGHFLTATTTMTRNSFIQCRVCYMAAARERERRRDRSERYK